LAKKKYKNLIHIAIDDETRDEINSPEFEGKTRYFRELRGFWHRHYELWQEEQDKKKKLKRYLEGK
jgi:hypothetical protein